jgi:hypothetical protein
VREILLAGEESQEWSTLLRNVVSDRAAQHRIASLKAVKDGTLSDRAFNLQLNLGAGDVCQRAQMIGQDNPDH